ncbi:MAG: ATP-binding cassette domain-containing protein [Bacteriovorax sp.]
MPIEYAIQTQNLTRKFKDKTVVDHLNLNIAQGIIFGLLGPNGAGKSTTIKMLTTLLPPTSGHAFVAGSNIEEQSVEVRKKIGYVPQLISSDGSLTADENLMLSAKLYRIPRSERQPRIDDALSFMGLVNVRSRLVKTYSGGMIRRLELAQAMLHRPLVLFLDEPTIGLDPVARRAVWEKLQEMRTKFHMTILISTHDMEEADVLCDELGILHRGVIAAVGKPEELKKQVGPEATLDDVFIHFSGAIISEGGNFGDVRQTRRTANRLG